MRFNLFHRKINNHLLVVSPCPLLASSSFHPTILSFTLSFTVHMRFMKKFAIFSKLLPKNHFPLPLPIKGKGVFSTSSFASLNCTSLIPPATLRQHAVLARVAKEQFLFQHSSAYPIIFANKMPDDNEDSYSDSVIELSQPISGLKTVTKTFIEILESDTPLGRELRRFVGFMVDKVTFNLLTTQGLTLAKRLTMCFHSMFAESRYFSMSKDLHKLVDGQIVSFIQHFIVLICNNKTFAYKVLKEAAGDIDCSSFESSKIHVDTFIELHGLKSFKNYFESVGIKNIKATIVNHEKPPHDFDSAVSMMRTGQKNCDFVFDDYISLKQYFDYKSYGGVNVDKCRVAFFYPTVKKLFQLVNNLMTTFQKFLIDNKYDDNHVMYKLYNELLDIREHHKGDVALQYKLMIELLVRALFNPIYRDLKLSLVLEAGYDLAFDKFKEALLAYKKGDLDKEVCLSFFPSNCRIDEVANKENIKECYNQIYNEEFASFYKQRLDEFLLEY